MDISLRQIRSFVHVARLGSFTAAADVLNLTQPTLTVQIRRLEEALDVRLFDRSTRMVTMTRVGQSLLPVFERLVEDLDAAITDTRDLAASRRGVVRIAALPSVAAAVLPGVIETFRRTYSGATFVIRDVVAERAVEMVRDEEVDIGITGGGRLSSEVTILRQKEEGFCAVFPTGHPLDGEGPVTVHDIAAHPIIMLHSSTSVREVVEDAFARAGETIRTACEATYMMTAAGLVSGGLGITILPTSAREVYAFPNLKTSPVAGKEFVRRVSVIVRKGRTLPPMSNLFVDHLNKVLD